VDKLLGGKIILRRKDFWKHCNEWKGGGIPPAQGKGSKRTPITPEEKITAKNNLKKKGATEQNTGKNPGMK